MAAAAAAGAAPWLIKAAPKLIKAVPLLLRGTTAARAVPYVGALAVTGFGIYQMIQSLLGNQTGAAMGGSMNPQSGEVALALAKQQREFDLQLQREHDRVNAMEVAASFTRGLEAAAKAAAAAAPPTNVMHAPALPVVAPVLTTKQKLAARWSAIVASPMFLPVLGAGLAVLSRPSTSSGGVPFEELPPPDLTGFESPPVEFLGGTLGGLDPEFFPQDEEPGGGGECEKVTPERTPGQCRQGWFAETPTQLLLTEWSRRPCQ